MQDEYINSDDLEEKSGGGWGDRFKDFILGKYFVPIVIVLIAIIAFSLGRVSGLQEKREPVRVIDNSSPNPLLLQQEKGASAQTDISEVKGVSTDSSGSVVASKNGTKYHYPWCAGAKQISAKNLVTFESIEIARAAGYTPASNCKGLK